MSLSQINYKEEHDQTATKSNENQFLPILIEVQSRP